MSDLTTCQQEVLRVIRTSLQKTGRTPTVRELALLLRRSKSTTQEHLRVLARKGYLAIDGSVRGITLTEKADQRANHQAVMRDIFRYIRGRGQGGDREAQTLLGRMKELME